MKYRVEVFDGWGPWYSINGGQVRRHGFYWRVRHVNGNKLGTSEAYTRHASAMKVAKRLASAAGWKVEDKTRTTARKSRKEKAK